MKLHYKKIGDQKPPLVILHGLFGSSDNWQTHGRKFSENFTVYLVDQRNHGHSPNDDAFSYQLMADDLKELFDDLELTGVTLMGHSMGGKTALWFAQQYPEYLEKMVVVDMGIKAYPMHHQQILAGLNAIDLNVVKTRGEADRILSEYVPELGVKQFLMKNLYWIEKGQLAWRINLPVLEREMPEILCAVPDEDVNVPTLFVRGELSNYILDEDEFSILQLVPHSMIETIDGAGHWVHAEAPGPFFDTVFDFIKD